MAEDLSSYLLDAGIKAKYLHSEIETIERVEIIRDLRKGVFDCLVGINLLREGLDLPEVSLVAILDADKEGFLRSYRPLVQTAGRAARNINGRVIMYADMMTDSMRLAISETERRRKIQEAYNIEHGITPRSIEKEILDILEREYHTDDTYAEYVADYRNKYRSDNLEHLKNLVAEIRQAMLAAAENLEFEKAAVLRDEMMDCEKKIELLKKAGK
jgi:excinuclease ABC subunit B